MDNGPSWGYKDLSGSKTGWGWGAGWKAFSKALCLFLVLSSLTRCGRQNDGLKDVHILTPRTCEYGTLCDKRGFAGLIKLRVLRWGDYPKWEVGPIKSSEFLLEGGRRMEREGSVRMKSEAEWHRGHVSRNEGNFQKPKKQESRSYPRAFRRNAALPTYFGIMNTVDCKIGNLCGFKPLDLLYFVIAEIGNKYTCLLSPPHLFLQPGFVQNVLGVPTTRLA